jgi:hypothetical protein
LRLDVDVRDLEGVRAMSEPRTLMRDAGERFHRAVEFAFDDALQRRLRYHLLRLTVVGMSHDEVPLIVELARRAFEDADVAGQATAIRERPGASVLASAIADVVERSRTGDQFAPRADVVVGAVVGAYAGLMDAGSADPAEATTAAVLGAVGGGTAVSVGRFIGTQLAAVGAAEYLRTDEQS